MLIPYGSNQTFYLLKNLNLSNSVSFLYVFFAWGNQNVFSLSNFKFSGNKKSQMLK